MPLFGKKKKQDEIPSLPDLPADTNLALPSKDDLPDVPPGLPEIETQELPTLPNSQENANQQAIKTAISTPQTSSELPPLMPKMQKSEYDIKTNLTPPIQPRAMEIGERRPTSTFGRPITKKIEPIYIRLDKFETTVEAFEEIQNKIMEIEKLLQKTREIKQKEEQELAEWEREIQMIKTRIDSIDKSIFNKLD